VRTNRQEAGAKEDIATFRVGGSWFAALTSEILEIIDGLNIVPLPRMRAGMVGCVMYRGAALSVFDLAEMAGQDDGTTAGKRSSGQIVVMARKDGTRFGLLVDDLGEIVEVLASRMTPLPSFMAGQEAFADTVIARDDADDSPLLVVLSAERLYGNLLLPGTTSADVSEKHAASNVIPLAKSA
jgi:chemotaxis signal transduction protein